MLRAVVLIALPLVLYASLQALNRQPVVPRGSTPRMLWQLQLLSARVVAVMFDSLLGTWHSCGVRCHPRCTTEPSVSSEPEQALQQGYQIPLAVAGITEGDPLHEQFAALTAMHAYARPDEVQRYINGNGGDSTAAYQALLATCQWREAAQMDDITRRCVWLSNDCPMHPQHTGRCRCMRRCETMAVQ